MVDRDRARVILRRRACHPARGRRSRPDPKPVILTTQRLSSCAQSQDLPCRLSSCAHTQDHSIVILRVVAGSTPVVAPACGASGAGASLSCEAVCRRGAAFGDSRPGVAWGSGALRRPAVGYGLRPSRDCARCSADRASSEGRRVAGWLLRPSAQRASASSAGCARQPCPPARLAASDIARRQPPPPRSTTSPRLGKKD